MERRFLLCDRKWLHWEHGPWAPRGEFYFRLCPPKKAEEPLLRADKPWEAMSNGWHTILLDGGRYRCWYEAWDETYRTDLDGRLCYAESDDGVTWRKPELGLVDYRGSRQNNILIEGATAFYGFGFHGSSVFIDPTASPEERYKLIYLGGFRPFFGEGWGSIMVQAYSTDGFHWQARRHPCWGGPPTLLAHASDTQTVAFWDPERRQYIGYFRSWEPGFGRCVARSETNDFYNWPAPKTIVRCDHLDGFGTDIYNNAANRYASGGDSAYFLFMSMFDHDTDDLYVQLAVSRDGIAFQRLDRSAFIPNGPAQFDRGGIYTAPSIVPYKDGLAIYYHGVSYKHGEATPDQIRYQGALGMTTLPRDRFQGVATDGEYEFSLRPFTPESPQMEIFANAVVEDDGEIRAALICDDEELPGLGFADSHPITGDQPAARLAWNTTVPSLAGKSVMVRFQLKKAALYAVTVEE